MPKFRNGTHVNKGFINGKRYKRLRVSAGPHRGQYVDKLILEAKLGRALQPGMTVEHVDGNTFNFGVAGSNLLEVTNARNVERMHERRNGTGDYAAATPAPKEPNETD